MRRLLLALLLLPTPAAADFRLDVPPEQFRKWQNVIVPSDLAVGERANFYWPLCSKDGTVFAGGLSEVLSDPPKSIAYYRVTRLPNNTASVEIITTDDGSDAKKKVRDALIDVVDGVGTCERRGAKDSDLIAIISINGFVSASEIVRAIDQSGNAPANP